MAGADTFLAKQQANTETKPSPENEKQEETEDIKDTLSIQETFKVSAEDDLDEEYLDIEALAAEHEKANQELILVDDALTNDEPKEQPQEVTDNSAEKVSDEEAQEFSFSRWLKQINKQGQETKPINEKVELEATPENPTKDEVAKEEDDENLGIAQKLELLDSFVEKLPHLKKRKDPLPASTQKSPGKRHFSNEDPSLVTETLAKVYLRQKHYKKAIKAYEILKLKYPEKSSFFASQILEIKNLANS